MSVNFRKITVIGTLGGDAEVRQTKTGTSVTGFNVASNWKDSEGNEQTTWFKVSWWGEMGAKVAQYLQKGKLIAVEGDFNPRPYEDKNGASRISLDIRAESVQILTSKAESDAMNGGSTQSKAALPAEENDDDVPF